MVQVRFHIHYIPSDNQVIVIKINEKDQHLMEKTIGNHWSVSITLPLGVEITWKYYVQQENIIIRDEECQDHRVSMFEEDSSYDVRDVWNFPRLTQIKSETPMKKGVKKQFISHQSEDLIVQPLVVSSVPRSPASPVIPPLNVNVLNVDEIDQPQNKPFVSSVKPLKKSPKAQKKLRQFSLDTSSYQNLRTSLIKQQQLKFDMLDKNIRFDDENWFCVKDTSDSMTDSIEV
ncbi:hypothetical protein EHI8A_145320 [Entamoeba histolytica HM-1:IMSS-B]|nr:Hypothetical protein EHI5A_015830 [Entamoeba histolytica KU27]EMH77921.1 hypothetical protein EHI8A_145320 [Entamoeba histolytica HM-1:IMSS-B]EMS11732.1 hypothetical protein KM1_299920 [Entamoeba histolytica HM-3:IMSS]GAT97282.1 hypothetical protein CL6EHI_056510 [Entamoeba histolytica]